VPARFGQAYIGTLRSWYVIYSLFYIDLLGSVCTASGYSHPVKFMCNLVLPEDWIKSSMDVPDDVSHEETFSRLFTCYSPVHIVISSFTHGETVMFLSAVMWTASVV
jgi:hypothetical protein